jgi:hypothetical protein
MYTRGPLPCETMPQLRQPSRNSPVRPPPRRIGKELLRVRAFDYIVIDPNGNSTELRFYS